jgi:hypothetical protein
MVGGKAKADGSLMLFPFSLKRGKTRMAFARSP